MGSAPMLGALLGGIVYARLGSAWLFGGAAGLVMAGVAVVWLALSAPSFSIRSVPATVVPTMEATT